MAVQVYQNISDDIRTQITHGFISANNALPSENTLSSQYNVSRMTV